VANFVTDTDLQAAAFGLAHSMLQMLDRNGVGPDVAARAERSADEVRAAVSSAAGPLRRLLWAVDPRPLWRRRSSVPVPEDEPVRRPLEPVG
jgi:hypothetical protein